MSRWFVDGGKSRVGLVAKVGQYVVSRVAVIGLIHGPSVFPCVGSKEQAGTRTAKLRRPRIGTCKQMWRP